MLDVDARGMMSAATAAAAAATGNQVAAPRRANVLSPGVTATPIFLDASSEEERAMYRSSIGISAPEDVVPTVLYLISDASANLTGMS